MMTMPQDRNQRSIGRTLCDIKGQLESALAQSHSGASTRKKNSPGSFDYDVKDLLAFDDAAFVQNAYRCLFRREPDSGGFEYNLGLLRSREMSKLEILQQLLTSEEGRQNAVRIVGLEWQKFAESRQAHPVEWNETAMSSADTPTKMNAATLSLNDFDHLSDREFVLVVYRILLTQTPLQEAAGNWEDMLSRGSLSRWEMASALAGSAEGRAAGAPMLAAPGAATWSTDLRTKLSALQLQVHECVLTIDHLDRLNAELRLRCRARQGSCGPEQGELEVSQRDAC